MGKRVYGGETGLVGWIGEKVEMVAMGNFPEQLQEGLEFEVCGWDFLFLWPVSLVSSSYPGSSEIESMRTWKAFGRHREAVEWGGRAGLRRQPACFKSQFYYLLAT